VLGVGGHGHRLNDLGQVGRAANTFKVPVPLEPRDEQRDVHRGCPGHGCHVRKQLAVRFGVEVLRPDDRSHRGQLARLHEDGAQHRTLRVEVARRLPVEKLRLHPVSGCEG